MKPSHLLLSCVAAFSLSWGLLALINPSKLTVIVVMILIPLLLLAAKTVKAVLGLLFS